MLFHYLMLINILLSVLNKPRWAYLIQICVLWEPWFVLWSFFLLRLLYISINLPYIYHAWDFVVMSGLVVLVPTCKCYISYRNICRTVGPSLPASLEPLAHWQNEASLSPRWSSELAVLVLPPYSRGRPTCYSDWLHDFSVTIPRCYKDVCQQCLSSLS